MNILKNKILSDYKKAFRAANGCDVIVTLENGKFKVNRVSSYNLRELIGMTKTLNKRVIILKKSVKKL
jgi:hypothetical protein